MNLRLIESANMLYFTGKCKQFEKYFHSKAFLSRQNRKYIVLYRITI